ncbi:hypothetical protein Clacol_006705 [Clathrus columnatus]|uniref:Peptidase S9 prolyl oligopeptidase catalytic domain-containing protein n=1 Tax=Clathrus columnatus TaxID=1419009 RepID=A0AAV5AIE6_9AGAM|nr:hypothetical protein Clacol_006705 [Clathrus columnatus]
MRRQCTTGVSLSIITGILTQIVSLSPIRKSGLRALNDIIDKAHLLILINVRWKSLRATEGWAALQHHNVLHTTIEIIPPLIESDVSQSLPWLSFSVQQASFFTLIPYHLPSGESPEWHPGNIYAFPNTPRQLIKPPRLSSSEPTRYHLFVSGDYEIRLFGDPHNTNHEDPILDIQIDVSIQTTERAAILDPHLNIIPDFWNGWIFGSMIGVAVCALDSQWTVIDVKSPSSAFELSLHHGQRISASQTRIVPVIVKQFESVQDETLDVELVLKDISTGRNLTLFSRIGLHHWTDSPDSPAIKATYLLAGSPLLYLAIPPTSFQSLNAPIIAIHGAGVEITNPFWPAALPRQSQSWIICPSGRTSWGLDWHGPSADDVWGSFAALKELLETRSESKSSSFSWKQLIIDWNLRPVIIGHSNGGQGTWYLASRYPDQVLAAVPAAAYIKSQQYIPLSLSRGSHFLDASRNVILLSALMPDDNDLFMSNVVDTPILAIHGGADENVPVWHSRELVSLVKSWKADAPISLHEEPGQSHWYSTVFSSTRFLEFLDAVLSRNNDTFYSGVHQFTLTVADSKSSGSLHGFSIKELVIPGRLARLHVNLMKDAVKVETENVYSFTFDQKFDKPFYVDDTSVEVASSGQNNIWIRRGNDDVWMASERSIDSARPTGPIQNILSSSMPLTIVTSGNIKTESIATRMAHAILSYFRIDVSIMSDKEAVIEGSIAGNIIILGSDNLFGQRVLSKGPGLIHMRPNEPIEFRNKIFTSESSIGMLFLHLNPFSSKNLVLFVVGTDNVGLERSAKTLLPFRTGVPLPEFLVLGPNTDHRASGGLRGAGFWNRHWGWSEEMAWLH